MPIVPDPSSLPWLAAIAFLGSFIYGVTGFGAGLIAIPLALLVVDMRTALAVFALIDSLNVVRVWLSQRGAVAREEAVRLLPSCAAGIALGLVLVLWLRAATLMLAYGGFLLAYSAYVYGARGAHRGIGLRWAWVAGLAGGVTSAMFGAGGPPFAIYLSHRGLPNDALRATLAATSLVSIGTRIVAFALGGLLAPREIWVTALTIAPATLLALWLAHRLHARLSRDAMLRAIRLLVLVAGVSLVVRALRGL
jgi:uncharacterized membrane protein YfcA